MLTKTPKGTKDLLPKESYKWHYVEGIFKNICNQFGYKEIRTPLFEHTELFKRGIGDTSDVVQKEMYTFNDLGNRSITLKPEGTSPVVRSFIENKLYADSLPLKVYYNTPCYRYERPQSGRLREFHQFGIEIFGTKSVLADLEVINLANKYLKELGLKKYELHINSIGCPNCREKYRDELKKFLKDKYDNLCETCKTRFEKNPMRILDCKSSECKQLIKDAPIMIDYLCDECSDDFNSLKHGLDILAINYIVDPEIVRGLDYYTKTAFEFVTNNLGAQNTICGGGRYDNLIEELGGPSTPGVGFGLGIERLLLTMEAENIEIPFDDSIDVFIAIISDKGKDFGLKLNKTLLDSNIKSQIDLMSRNIKGQLKYANKINAKKVVIVGDDELNKNIFQVKDMMTSSQDEVPFDDLLNYLIK